VTLELVQDIVLAIFALTVMVTDFRWQKIPNVVTYPVIVLGLGLSLLEGFPGAPLGGGPVDHLLAIGVAFVGLYPLYSARAMKAGDVKLLMAVGALRGLAFLFWAFVYGAILGGLVAVLYIGYQRLLRGRALSEVLRTFIPYGVSLAAGALLALAKGIGR
jgi:prepilin peptidase CpaA